MVRAGTLLVLMLALVTASVAFAGQRGRIAVGMTILPACPPLDGSRAEDVAEPGERTTASPLKPDLEALSRCMPAPARLARLRQDALDHPPARAESGRQVLLIEF